MKIEGVLVIIVLVFVFIFGTVLGGIGGKTIMKEKIIEKGYAIYHPKTGDFVWKDELENEGG